MHVRVDVVNLSARELTLFTCVFKGSLQDVKRGCYESSGVVGGHFENEWDHVEIGGIGTTLGVIRGRAKTSFNF